MTESAKTRLRLTGIDLFRGVGAFAVAILHSGDSSNSLTVDQGAVALRQFCAFVVPFFLITSFYLAIHRFSLTGKSYSIHSRIQRLLIPYAFWSIVYLLVRSLKFLVLNELDEFEKINDITSVVFFGAASVPLYFIPLLFVGSLLLFVAEYLIEQGAPFYRILILFLASIIGYQLIIDSNNYFQLGPNVAFQGMISLVSLALNQNQFLRIILVFLEWLAQCAPYVFAAMVLNYFLLKNEFKQTQKFLMWTTLIVFLGLSLLGNYLLSPDSLPPVLYQVARATSLLLFSIQFSAQLPTSSWIKSLGECSFGIYLIHYLIIQILRSLLGKFQPEFINHLSIFSQLLLASFSFSISWLSVAYLIHKKQISRLIFGI